MVKKFQQTVGRYIEKIYGQERLAYAVSSTEDFYDLIEWSERGGYQGNEIYFYDYENGQVYQPFVKKKNTVYSSPIYVEGFYYFLQGDYDEKRITLFKYLPETTLGIITTLSTADVDLYNLHLVGNPIHIVSQDESIRCYYPEVFSFSCEPNETLEFIESGKVYLDAWVEEGWDKENECATDHYQYYEKVIVKDFSGRTLSEERGSLHQAPDGSWWIS